MNVEDYRKEEYTEDDMAVRIPVLSDIVIKYIFGTESSVEILKAFINAVLSDADFPTIKTVTVKNPFNEKTYIDEKYSVIDTRAEDEKGNTYNVEVQMRTQADFRERSLYYWAKTYADQLKNGELYGNLNKVISITILNFNLFPEHIPCHSCFMLRENNSTENVLTEDCTMHYLEVPKLNLNPESEIDKWVYFFEFADKEDESVKVLIDNSKMLKAAKERYDYFIADERARIAYLQREKFLRDQANYIHTARLEGLAEGHAEGHSAGHAAGHIEGVREKAFDTAGKLKKIGLSNEQIAEVTGIEKAEIEFL